MLENENASKILIEAINIKKSFADLHTLEDVSVTLVKNQFVSILGPSGCGKSTLFDIISGLEKPDRGNVFIEGRNFNGKTGRVSYMHQKDLLFPWNSVLDNVTIPLRIRGMGKTDARKKAKEHLSIFGLEGFENSYPSQLSGGMRQRAALLRTCLFSKDIMLLDEPFGSLDAITRHKMQQWLLDIWERIESSIMFITHDIDEAIFLSDRIYLLSHRPAVVKKIFDISIRRPRDNSSIISREFIEIKKQILDLLY
ncbi:MAG: ABC transporter ATP-binding protein [Actinobacteria bacterium]|nr:ABC transporter ATP-binding protein [Actinomycetota bacterium]